MVVTLTFDVEEFDFPLERGREIDFGTQMEVSTEGLCAVLALLDKYALRATFYVTANYALHKPDLIREIAAAGHEIASHDYYHGVGSTPDPAGAKKILEQITGSTVTGYRAPRLGRTPSSVLAAAGFRYNSSLNPTCIPGRYNNLRKPRTIFCEEGLTIYPTSVSYPFRIPLFWLAFHVFGLGLYKRLSRSAMHHDGHLNLYFHPWEFSDQLTDKRFGVPGYISRCSGTVYLNKFEALVRYFKSQGYRFTTTQEYLDIHEKACE